MGRIGAAGDGMVTHPRSTRVGSVLAAIRRAVRPIPTEPYSPRIPANCRVTSSPPGAGGFHSALSIILVGIGLWIRPWHSWNRQCSSSSLNNKKIEKAPIIPGFETPAGDIPIGIPASVEQAPFYIFTTFIFAHAVGLAYVRATSS